MTKQLPSKISRRRLTIPAVAAGAVGSVAIAASMGASLSGLTATITNSLNTSSSASMAIQETSGAVQCNSYDTTTTCDSINKYGGLATPLAPGASKTTTVTFKNAGQVAVGTSTLAPGTCTAAATAATGATTPTTPNTTAGNLCSVLQVQVFKGADNTGTSLYNGALSAFTANVDLGTLAVNATQAYTFVVTLPNSTAAVNNSVRGQSVSQPLVWTYNQ